MFKGNVVMMVLSAVALLYGDIAKGIDFQVDGDFGDRGQIQKGVEVSTYFIKGELLTISSGAYVIRDVDGQEHTVIVTKETSMLDRPKIGEQVEVEYLENGKALVVIVKHSKK